LSSSLPTPPAEPAFWLANELGPLLVVATLGGAVLAPLSSSSLLPWELSLSPSEHAKLSQQWKSWFKWKQSQHK
jgi:hypothetical protein